MAGRGELQLWGAAFGLHGYHGGVSVAVGERGKGTRWMKVTGWHFGRTAASPACDSGELTGHELKGAQDTVWSQLPVLCIPPP